MSSPQQWVGPSVGVDTINFAHLSISLIQEGSGEREICSMERDALLMSLEGSAVPFIRLDHEFLNVNVQPHDSCLIPAGSPISVVWKNHRAVQSKLLVQYDRSVFGGYLPEISSDRLFSGHLVPSNFSARPALGDIVRLLGREIDPGQRRGRLYAEAVIRLLALELAASAWSVPAKLPEAPLDAGTRLSRAIDYIEAYFTHDLSVIDIAAAGGLSPTQLGRAFLAATGRTPYGYVIDRRLRHATHLLRNTAMPIAVVALEAGFTDQSHLTRAARRHLGVTPRAIRLSRQ